MSFSSSKQEILVQRRDDPLMEEESSSLVSSPSPSLSPESTGDTHGGEDFTNEEVYVLDATNPPKEMVTATSQQLRSMLSNDLSFKEKDEFLKIFKDISNLFVTSYHDFRHVTAIEHRIELKQDAKPVD